MAQVLSTFRAGWTGVRSCGKKRSRSGPGLPSPGNRSVSSMREMLDGSWLRFSRVLLLHMPPSC
jgi:hypothetical protein